MIGLLRQPRVVTGGGELPVTTRVNPHQRFILAQISQ